MKKTWSTTNQGYKFCYGSHCYLHTTMFRRNFMHIIMVTNDMKNGSYKNLKCPRNEVQ